MVVPLDNDFGQFPFLEASIWGGLYTYFGEGIVISVFIFYVLIDQVFYSPWRAFSVLACAVIMQSAPTASVAADIVYRHIPSAICISEVIVMVIVTNVHTHALADKGSLITWFHVMHTIPRYATHLIYFTECPSWKPKHVCYWYAIYDLCWLSSISRSSVSTWAFFGVVSEFTGFLFGVFNCLFRLELKFPSSFLWHLLLFSRVCLGKLKVAWRDQCLPHEN